MSEHYGEFLEGKISAVRPMRLTTLAVRNGVRNCHSYLGRQRQFKTSPGLIC